MHARFALFLLVSLIASLCHAADFEPQQSTAQSASTAESQADSRALMTGEQVVQILDETVDWYRTLGTQQQAATQPSDLLILYANRQIADKVMTLAFEIARANAELISSDAGAARERAETASTQSLDRMRKDLDERRAAIQEEIAAARRELRTATGQDRTDLQARIPTLQSKLDLVNARHNLLTNMAQFQHQNDAEGFGPNALKAHIDAIAASIPASTPPVASSTPAATASSGTPAAPTAAATAAATVSLTDFGIWDLTATVLRLSAKGRTIETVDRRTAELQKVLEQIRTRPMERLKNLTARGETLAARSEEADASSLRGVRDQYDTLAWLYQQTSSIVTPLSNAEVLLNQYRRNLDNWREATQRQYREALRALGLRFAVFVGMLLVVFAAAALWKRAVFRYVHEPRRRSRFLLLRKIVLWALVVAIAASTFATELGSLATFAGLITAGLAVAMQSVLVSVVGYFFLIGKYGVRVGDRVQIGNVTGEVIDMGLVRMHLMELSGQGLMSPTGRVVAFANSIIFQASGGLFKQIPGVNLAWHEITVALPAGSDYTVLKDKLAATVSEILKDYRKEIAHQAGEIRKTASSHATGEPEPQVRLRFSAASVDAIVRYPVPLTHAAEIDERVSREVLHVIAENDTSAPRGQLPDLANKPA